MPLKVIPFPDDRHLLVMSNGFTEHFIAVVDVESAKVTQRLPIKQGWLGVAVSSDGTQVFASAGGEDRILVYHSADGQLTPAPDIKLDKGTFPAGLSLGRGGKSLFVAANLSNALQIVDLESGKVPREHSCRRETLHLRGDCGRKNRLCQQLGRRHYRGH